MTTLVEPTRSAPALSAVPDVRGRFGKFGGRFIPETLMFAAEQLAAAYEDAKRDPQFNAQFRRILAEYVGRPSRLYFAERLTKEAGGARIYLKREDLNHHWRTQDQQRDWPSIANHAHGQETHHRGNWSRSAWRRVGDGSGPVWPLVSRLHG